MAFHICCCCCCHRCCCFCCCRGMPRATPRRAMLKRASGEGPPAASQAARQPASRQQLQRRQSKAVPWRFCCAPFLGRRLYFMSFHASDGLCRHLPTWVVSAEMCQGGRCARVVYGLQRAWLPCIAAFAAQPLRGVQLCVVNSDCKYV